MIKCFNCGKMGHFASNYTKEKKDGESIDGDESGVDHLNFDEFEDDESCESGDCSTKVKGESKDN